MYFRKEAWLKPSWFTKATKGVRMSLYHHKVVGFFLRLSPTEGSLQGRVSRGFFFWLSW
jgi:hypothetical protein